VSIKLRFEKGTLITQVVLKDAALAPLLALVSEHQSDEPPVSTMAIQPAPPPAASIVVAATEVSATIKEWLLKHSPTEILNRFEWVTNPEKILLLGAFHEAASSNEVWRSADIEERFREARETFPTNFPRDIKNAIRAGLIQGVTARTYRVSRTGWNRIKEAIEKIEHPQPLPSLF
jgi:hypothetical protein